LWKKKRAKHNSKPVDHSSKSKEGNLIRKRTHEICTKTIRRINFCPMRKRRRVYSSKPVECYDHILKRTSLCRAFTSEG